MPYPGADSDSAPDVASEFDDRTCAYQIVAFLALHPDEGFSKQEIAIGTGIKSDHIEAELTRLEVTPLVDRTGTKWTTGIRT